MRSSLLTQVSLLIRGPGVSAGHRVGGLTSHIDLAPTLLARCGVSPASDLDGLDLSALLAGETNSLRDHCFGEYHPTVRHDLYNQTVYTDRWRYTVYPALEDWGELFDIADDPGETDNRYFDPSLAALRADLDTLLAADFAPQPRVDNPMLAKW